MGLTAHAEDCGEVPPEIQQQAEEAKQFRSSCSAANVSASQSQGSSSRSVVINDYTKGNGKSYVFDQNGQCVFSTPAAYGSGSKGEPPTAGCGGGSKQTPSGYHVLMQHEGAKYNSSNSFLMMDLQGQGSAGRAILMHVSKDSSGGATTWGCSGIPQDKFMEMKQQNLIGIGTIVFNKFSNNGSGCPDQKSKECKPGQAPAGGVHRGGSEGEQGDDSGGNK